MTATIPALAVTAFDHDLARARAMWPTRGGASLARTGAAISPGTFRTARLVAGSQPESSASIDVPSPWRTVKVSPRPSTDAAVTTTPSAYTTPLAGRRRPCTCTTEFETA